MAFPEKVLQKWIITKGVRHGTLVLVKWSSLSADLTTWEDLEAMKQQFPRAATWGQVSFQGEGNVSPEEEEPKEDGPHTGKRTRKPNSKVHEPEWLNTFAHANSLSLAVY